MTRYHSRAHPTRITPAERRSFELACAGQTTREIADAHGLAIATVEVQIRTVREKMGARTLIQAAYLAGRGA